ncbi:uncharacterized protein M6B38_251915 [Iris pallida]|uniref:Uncharacterized protein n=1 Tax=Iris pallida TaxID=29817 RepID=A0AAX6IIE9_IRIPA|nr:uncharacterized protein M6B38_251915 [Iris pallida]
MARAKVRAKVTVKAMGRDTEGDTESEFDIVGLELHHLICNVYVL